MINYLFFLFFSQQLAIKTLLGHSCVIPEIKSHVQNNLFLNDNYNNFFQKFATVTQDSLMEIMFLLQKTLRPTRRAPLEAPHDPAAPREHRHHPPRHAHPPVAQDCTPLSIPHIQPIKTGTQTQTQMQMKATTSTRTRNETQIRVSASGRRKREPCSRGLRCSNWNLRSI